MISMLAETLRPWTWIVVGLLLAALELVAPGVFLIWLGLAALLTGVIDALFGLSWQMSLVVFAILAVLSVVVGWRVSHTRSRETPEQPFLNRRGDALVGRTFTLETPILRGEGKVRVGDSVWRVTGPDMVAGASVRVASVEGATLVVEPA